MWNLGLGCRVGINHQDLNSRAPFPGFDWTVCPFVLYCRHRDAWQNIGQILDSKGNLASYILEVTQQLGLNYKAPALPVNLRQLKVAEDAEDEDEKRKNDTTQKAEDFRGIVDSFNIRLN